VILWFYSLIYLNGRNDFDPYPFGLSAFPFALKGWLGVRNTPLVTCGFKKIKNNFGSNKNSIIFVPMKNTNNIQPRPHQQIFVE